MLLFQEKDREDDISRLKLDVDELTGKLGDKAQQLARCETVIEDLTQELGHSQDDLNKAFDKIAEHERKVIDLQEQLAISQQEVSV